MELMQLVDNLVPLFVFVDVRKTTWLGLSGICWWQSRFRKFRARQFALNESRTCARIWKKMFARITNFLKFFEKQKRHFLKASQGELNFCSATSNKRWSRHWTAPVKKTLSLQHKSVSCRTLKNQVSWKRNETCDLITNTTCRVMRHTSLFVDGSKNKWVAQFSKFSNYDSRLSVSACGTPFVIQSRT